MLVRAGTEADVGSIADLHTQSWRAAYRGILSDYYLDGAAHEDRLTSWQKRYSDQHANPMLVMVAELDGELAGFICIFPDEDAVFGSLLDNLHIAPNLTGSAIGRRLVSEAVKRLIVESPGSGMYLWVFARNHGARRFYERAGAIAADSAEKPMPDGNRVLSVRYHWPDPAILVL